MGKNLKTQANVSTPEQRRKDFVLEGRTVGEKTNHRRVLNIKQKEATMKNEAGGSDNRSQELTVKEDTRHLSNQTVPGTIAIRKGSVCFQCKKKREKKFMLSVKSQIKFR